MISAVLLYNVHLIPIAENLDDCDEWDAGNTQAFEAGWPCWLWQPTGPAGEQKVHIFHILIFHEVFEYLQYSFSPRALDF